MPRLIDPREYAEFVSELGHIPQPGELVCVMLRGGVWSGRVTPEMHTEMVERQAKLWGLATPARLH